MKSRKILYADEGKILTNGEIYGKQIFLADGMNEYHFYEITEEEYEEIMQAEENDIQQNT